MLKAKIKKHGERIAKMSNAALEKIGGMESGPPLLLIRRRRIALSMRSGLNKTELKSGKSELRIEPGENGF